MAEDSAKRFIELVIATTIGSIVGAYIARDIQFSFALFVRAIFATALLALFFFAVWQFSTRIGKRKRPHKSEAIVSEPEEPVQEETEEYRANEYEGYEESTTQEELEEEQEVYKR